MSLKKKTLNGLKWVTVEQGSVQGLNFIFGIVMARLLTPEDFGIVAMVTVFTGFFGLFVDGGLGSSLIYKKELDEIDKSSMFWVNVIIGLLLAILLGFSAPLIANFYQDVRLVLVTQLIAINLFLSSTTPVQLALFRKKLNFQKIFTARVISLFLSGLLGVFLAVQGFGVWSLINRMLAMTTIFSVILWLFSKWRPVFQFNWIRLKALLSYSLPLLGNNMLGYAKRNMDTLFVGKYLGAIDLGIYNKSYQMMALPGNQLTSILGHVLFSSFTKMNHDKSLVWHAYLTATKGIFLISIVMALTIFFVAESFVVNILGEKWMESIEIIKIMAFASLAQPTVRSIGAIFNSMGATKISFRLSLFTTPIFLLAIFFGAQFGIQGVAYAVVFAIFFTSLPQLHYAVKLVDKKLLDLFKGLWPYMACAGLLFLAGWAFTNSLYSLQEWWLLPLIPVGLSLLMILFLYLLFPLELKKLRGVMKV